MVAARRALDCVEAIVRRADALNATRTARGEAEIRLAVGAHFGRVTIGDVGSEDRLEMAVLGDAVNVASRLEASTRALGAGAAVSDALLQAAGGPRAGWRARGAQALKGRGEGVEVWSLDRAETAAGTGAGTGSEDASGGAEAAGGEAHETAP